MKHIFIFIILTTCFSCQEKSLSTKTVLFQHYFTGRISSGINDLTDAVNKNQNNFTLISVPLDHEEFKVSIRTQLEGQNPPDLFSYWAGSRTKYLLDNNKIQPITDLFLQNNSYQYFDQAVIDACTYNGETYLLPITRHYVGFFYNIDLFEKFNIKIPDNWEELIFAAKQLKSNGITPFELGSKNRWPAQFWFDYLILRTAGFKYREELMNNSASYTDPEVLYAVELWKDLIDNDFFNVDPLEYDWDEATLHIVSGKSAMTLMGTWAIPLLESEGLKANENYGFFKFPIINNNIDSVSLGPIDGVLLSKATDNSKNAKEVIKRLSNVKTQSAFNKNTGAVAPHIEVKNNIYNPIQLEIKDYIKESKNWAFNYDLAATPIISEAGLSFFNSFILNTESYKTLLEELEVYKLNNM